MSLTPLVGHREVRERLAAAIDADRLPQVLLVTGPAGVGKQRLALWLAERLLCEAPSDKPCGRCGSCKRVLELAHPDVHWLVPIPRPKAGDPDKQVEEAAETLQAVMAERRAEGRWGRVDGMANHGIASARLLQRRAALTAVEGGWRVFIIGHAERLVPQESSQEAANALLKLLEEPPRRSLFVLTTAQPGMVLPTIRSRAVPLRLGALSTAEQAEVGQQETGGDENTARSITSARAVRQAVAGSDSDRATAALRQGVANARGEFTVMLDALAAGYQAEAREAAGSITGRPRAAAANRAIELVMAARERAQGNVNPQLALGGLADELAALTERVRRLRPDEALISTSFHQSPLPLALLLRAAG
ncbi:MAG TPA: DNA polymerase III subunit, partial [Gemmatimonadales bacterium]|nr:DNA polymerase III subunit [Gemmatimonadales bacterium]